MSIAASLLSCPSTSTSVTFNLQAKPKEGEESNKQAVRSCRIRRRQLAKVQQQEAAYHGTKTSCFRDHDPWTGTLGLPRDGPPYMHDLWTFVCPVRITNNIFCYRKVKRTAATAKAWRRLPHALPAHSWVIGSLLVCGMPPNSIKLLPICNSVDRFRYLHSRTEREREREAALATYALTSSANGQNKKESEKETKQYGHSYSLNCHCQSWNKMAMWPEGIVLLHSRTTTSLVPKQGTLWSLSHEIDQSCSSTFTIQEPKWGPCCLQEGNLCTR
jgi:hypothetical protein